MAQKEFSRSDCPPRLPSLDARLADYSQQACASTRKMPLLFPWRRQTLFVTSPFFQGPPWHNSFLEYLQRPRPGTASVGLLVATSFNVIRTPKGHPEEKKTAAIHCRVRADDNRGSFLSPGLVILVCVIVCTAPDFANTHPCMENSSQLW